MATKQSLKFTVPVGEAVVHELFANGNYPTIVGVAPAETGTAVVALQIVRGGTWYAADGNLAGTIAAAEPKADVLPGSYHAIRVTATTAAAVVEISQ